MQFDCTCACAVACLHPHNFISNVVVSLTIHDNMYIYTHIIYIYVHVNVIAYVYVYVYVYVYGIWYMKNGIWYMYIYMYSVFRLVRPRQMVTYISQRNATSGGNLGGVAIRTRNRSLCLEKGTKDKPNHLTTDSFRSVPQESWS